MEPRTLIKTVEVAAAIIKHDGKILATQRSYGDCEGGWEFPGGKLEPGEDGAAAAVREIREELDCGIAVDKFVVTVDYDYEKFHLTMHCYLCHVASGKIKLLEHKSAKWLDRASLDSVEWLPADKVVIEAVKEQNLV